MRLSEAARAAQGCHVGADVEFHGCLTDSRAVMPGALFVALKGPRFDGHGFVHQAHRVGAAAAMVDHGEYGAVPCLRVEDTLGGLGRLARAWRRRFELPVVAVTGSNGKTTVKELLAAVFREQGPVLATHGNLNNEIGVPLTLFRMGGDHRAAVIEMGASHAGEIRRLAAMTRPTVGVVTQCGPAHLEGFGSLDGVAQAKGELFEALDEDGLAVINADDPYAPLWRTLAGSSRCLTFGLQPGADVCARYREDGDATRLDLETPRGRCEVRLRMPGRHNVSNALAAAAAALAAGVSLDAVARGLTRAHPVAGRLTVRDALGGARVIDDTYNANPLSLQAGLELIKDSGQRRWLVLGDMGELGERAEEFHRQAGELARISGVERLYATGPLSRLAVEAFGPDGVHYDERAALCEDLRGALEPGVVVLVKGSRMMHMEDVIGALTRDAAMDEG